MGEGNLDIPLDKVNQIINQQSKLVSTPGGTLNKTTTTVTTTLLVRLFLQVQTTTTTTTTGGGSLYNRLDIKPISKDQIFLKDNLNSSSTTTILMVEILKMEEIIMVIKPLTIIIKKN